MWNQFSSIMSCNSKKVDKAWQKRAGLNLKHDKPRILREELANAKKESRAMPTVPGAQVHVDTSKPFHQSKYVSGKEECF